MTTTQTRATHTPGPWKAERQESEPSRGHRVEYVVHVGMDGVLAQVWLPSDGDAEKRSANAALIAAAPDYYDAAEAIRAYVVAAERLDDGCECSIPADLVRALLDAHRRAYANP